MMKKSNEAWDKQMQASEVDVLKLLKAILQGRPKENEVNLSLLQRPKKIKAGTKTAFVYAPSEVTVNDAIDIGDAINIVDVFEGDTPAETTLKVMTVSDWEQHVKGCCQEDGEMLCTTRQDGYDRNDNPCHCHMEPADMPEVFRAKVHYVLLSDIGK